MRPMDTWESSWSSDEDQQTTLNDASSLRVKCVKNLDASSQIGRMRLKDIDSKIFF